MKALKHDIAIFAIAIDTRATQFHLEVFDEQMHINKPNHKTRMVGHVSLCYDNGKILNSSNDTCSFSARQYYHRYYLGDPNDTLHNMNKKGVLYFIL